MRILMLNYEFPPLGGGASPVCQGLARELVKAGHEVDVVTMGFKGLKRFEIIEGIKVYRVPCLRRRKEVCQTYEMLSYCMTALPTILQLVRRNKYSLNHTHFIFPTGLVSYLVKKLTGLPYIITAHGSDVKGYNPDRFKVEHILFLWLWKVIVRNSSGITTPSESLKGRILDLIKDIEIEVIPNGVYLPSYSPGLKGKKILMAGRLLERKGFQYVIEALVSIPTNDFEVNVVGDGPYARFLRRLAEEKRVKVNFWGWIERDSPQFRALYATSSIFVLPSEQESFGMALVDAMAWGMAVIASNISACPEVVGEAGLLVEPRNVNEIRSKLVQLMGDEALRSKLGRLARKRVEENYSWEVVLDKFLRVYREFSARGSEV